MTQAQQAPLAPVRPRMVVPDIARGLALLGIALANIATAWAPATEALSGASLGGIRNAADPITIMVTAVTAHSRGLPMFSTLLGFGIGLIAISLWRKNVPLKRARWQLIRRYGLLALFGVAHGVFLFFGDIMMLYGLAGIVFALMIALKNKTLMIIAWVLLGLSFVIGIFTSVAVIFVPPELIGSLMPELAGNYAETLGVNAGWMVTQLTNLPMFLISYGPVMIIGFVWARTGILANVPQHRAYLWRWVIAGVIVALGAGIPWGLAVLDVLPEEYAFALMNLNIFFGVVTGPAILAGLALALQGIQEHTESGAALPSALVPIAALGKRSMSGYILQSIVLFILVQPYMLNMGKDVGATMLAVMALAVWLITVVAAWVWELLGWPGPFEWVHRRLSYGAEGSPNQLAFTNKHQPSSLTPR